jgi:hypothetical protein
MDLQDNNTITSSFSNTFKNPTDLLGEILILVETVPHILDDYTKNYILYHKNTQNSENASLFENVKSNLESANSKLFILNNTVEKGIEDINQKLVLFNNQIQTKKTNNNKMKQILYSIENKYNASDERIDNYKEMYNNQYFKNVTMLIGILIGIVLLTKVFAKSVIP